jgi:hypothetical protein
MPDPVTLTIAARAAKFFGGLSITVWLVVALVASGLLNLHQYGSLRAAAADCRASTAEAILKAIEAHKDAQAKVQAEVDETAAAETKADDNTLAEIVSSTDATLAALRRQYADAMLRRPLDCARQPALRLHTVNAALSRPRSD